jgi:hypothetical protein
MLASLPEDMLALSNVLQALATMIVSSRTLQATGRTRLQTQVWQPDPGLDLT